MSKAKTESYASVWDALSDTTEEAANLRVRTDLMSQIAAIVQENGWTQTEAARRCGVTQPRINDLLRGRLSRFSLDALVNIAAALGRRVHVELGVARVSQNKKRAASVRPPSRRRGALRGASGRAVGTREGSRGGAHKKGTTTTP